MKIFVTGGTGLLGYNIVKALSAKQYQVTALVRSKERGRKILGNDIRLIEGDMLRVEKFADQFADAEVLIHAAACYSEFYRTGNEKRPLETNMAGTMALLRRAYAQGIRRVVYISSAGVLKAGKNQVVDESGAYNESTRDPYFRSKVKAEKAVLEFAKARTDLIVTVLMPTVMLGPGDWGPTPTGKLILKLLKADMKIILPGSNRIVDARDVAAAVLAAIESDDKSERYLLGGRIYPFADIYQTLGRVSGIPMPTKSPPASVLRMVAFMAVIKSKLNGKPPALKPSILKRFLDNFEYDSGKAEKDLGIEFRPLSETLLDTAEWFQHQLSGRA